MTRFIFVVGGVCSSLGKGIAAASIGTLLKRSGYSVFSIKVDPYLNVDPGTMNPEQHGEVFVTEDGAETDLDLGHYERFLDQPLSRLSTLTMGRVYEEVITKEREGAYLGKTIQTIPHITDAIKKKLFAARDSSKADIILVEIGGTVGDIEAQPCFEAARQIIHELGKHKAMMVMLTLLPYLESSKELKTKPTQMSTRELQRAGLFPDVILTRSDRDIKPELLEKISHFCNVDREAVIPAQTVPSIYEVPLRFASFGLHKIICAKLELPLLQEPNLDDLKELIEKIYDKDLPVLQVALVVKYHELDDAYLSVFESIKAACYAHMRKPKIVSINSELLEEGNEAEWEKLKKCHAVLVPGGFGSRGIEGKIKAITYAREEKIPYLGICLGAQLMAIEFARNVAGIVGATSEEFDPKAKDLLVHIMEDQKTVTQKGGTMRKGNYPCTIKEGTKAFAAYGKTLIYERHRHRFEFNNAYRKQLEKAGLLVSGSFEERTIMEIIELKDHPFMMGVQYHPEFLSRPQRPEESFYAWIGACM